MLKDFYVKNSVKVEIFYNSDRLEILDVTLKVVSEIKDVKVTFLQKFEFKIKDLLDSAIFGKSSLSGSQII